MTKADLKKSHDAMARFLVKLCNDSDRIYQGWRTAGAQKNYRAAKRLIQRAGFEPKRARLFAAWAGRVYDWHAHDRREGEMSESIEADTDRFLRRIGREKIREPRADQYVDRCEYSKTGWGIWDKDGGWLQMRDINMLAGEQPPISAKIAAIRADLAAWSAGKPPKVQNAVANLDGWLGAAERVDPHADYDGVIVVDCVRRAVETLRRATGRA